MILPELPEGLKVLRNAHGYNHYFTALQMDKYGRDCAQAATEALAAERDAINLRAQRLQDERDAALAASRHETDLCQQALDDMMNSMSNVDKLQGVIAAYKTSLDASRAEVFRVLAERDKLQAALNSARNCKNGSNCSEDCSLPSQASVGSKPEKREHITTGEPCWCNPDRTYKDPKTGAEVIVHKEPQ